jgi:hypothetical protein
VISAWRRWSGQTSCASRPCASRATKRWRTARSSGPRVTCRPSRPRERATTLSDVYGLGAILYSLLTGRPPFRADSAETTLEQVRDATRTPDHPRSVNPTADRTLSAIAMKCLEKDPARRYSSAEGLAKDLDRWLTHRRTEARPRGPVGRCRLWCRGILSARAGARLLSPQRAGRRRYRDATRGTAPHPSDRCRADRRIAADAAERHEACRGVDRTTPAPRGLCSRRVISRSCSR